MMPKRWLNHQRLDLLTLKLFTAHKSTIKAIYCKRAISDHHHYQLYMANTLPTHFDCKKMILTFLWLYLHNGSKILKLLKTVWKTLVFFVLYGWSPMYSTSLTVSENIAFPITFHMSIIECLLQIISNLR